MALLSDADRAAVAADYMAELSAVREPLVTMSKTDIRAAVDALDAWLNANAASANSALPATFRNGATQSQKGRLNNLIVQKRYIKGA
jgi:hypothetical protein